MDDSRSFTLDLYCVWVTRGSTGRFGNKATQPLHWFQGNRIITNEGSRIWWHDGILSWFLLGVCRNCSPRHDKRMTRVHCTQDGVLLEVCSLNRHREIIGPQCIKGRPYTHSAIIHRRPHKFVVLRSEYCRRVTMIGPNTCYWRLRRQGQRDWHPTSSITFSVRSPVKVKVLILTLLRRG